jgi:hypothetical protein
MDNKCIHKLSDLSTGKLKIINNKIVCKFCNARFDLTEMESGGRFPSSLECKEQNIGISYSFRIRDISLIRDKIKDTAPFMLISAHMIDKFLSRLSVPILTKYSEFKSIFHTTDYYSSVQELISFYDKYKDYIVIIDQFNSILIWEEFEEEFIDNDSGMSNSSICNCRVDKDGYEWAEIFERDI